MDKDEEIKLLKAKFEEKTKEVYYLKKELDKTKLINNRLLIQMDNYLKSQKKLERDTLKLIKEMDFPGYKFEKEYYDVELNLEKKTLTLYQANTSYIISLSKQQTRFTFILLSKLIEDIKLKIDIDYRGFIDSKELETMLLGKAAQNVMNSNITRFRKTCKEKSGLNINLIEHVNSKIRFATLSDNIKITPDPY
ncbi:MAG: hypothetical protein MJB14_09165 [Spirochaetes bacterium]|nr:hypothetical protein [Spirochaetota bacterium]